MNNDLHSVHPQPVAIVYGIEASEIDRDRDIISALIVSATEVSGYDCPQHAEVEMGPLKAAARSFLIAWYKRKLPTLDFKL